MKPHARRPPLETPYTTNLPKGPAAYNGSFGQLSGTFGLAHLGQVNQTDRGAFTALPHVRRVLGNR